MVAFVGKITTSLNDEHEKNVYDSIIEIELGMIILSNDSHFLNEHFRI